MPIKRSGGRKSPKDRYHISQIGVGDGGQNLHHPSIPRTGNSQGKGVKEDEQEGAKKTSNYHKEDSRK